MQKATAIKIAIDCIKKERQKFVFDANLYKAGVVSHHTQRFAERCGRLNDAIAILQEMLKKS